MKIEIDTKADSKEEIKHAIRLLEQAINAASGGGEIFTNEPTENPLSTSQTNGASQTAIPESNSGAALAGIFGDDSPSPVSQVAEEPVSMVIPDEPTDGQEKKVEEADEWEQFPSKSLPEEEEEDVKPTSAKVEFY